MKIKLTLTTREPVIIRKDDVSVICKSSSECFDDEKRDMFYPTSIYVHSGVKFEVFESVEDVERMVFGGRNSVRVVPTTVEYTGSLTVKAPRRSRMVKTEWIRLL